MPKHDTVPAGDAKTGNFADDLWRDLRYSFRTMRKSPIFVLFVVLTLALGIGANTTVFTVINTLILNPLPVRDAGGLAAVSAADAKNSAKPNSYFPLSYADLKDYQARNEAFSSFAGYTFPRGVTLLENGAATQMFGELVTANYFSTLGLTPAKGRFFLPAEGRTPGGAPVAVISYGAWQARFSGAAGIIGKTIELDNIAFTIVGVAPPKFIGVNAIFGPEIWVPATMAEQLSPGGMQSALTNRSRAFFEGLGRLKPGITLTQAQVDLASIASALAREYPATDEGHAITVRPIRDVVFASAQSDSRPVLFASAGLLIVVGIVLLIACSNVANLLMARAQARQQEMAVRLAMGASRPRLIRQLLTESLLLGLFGGALGLSFGYVGLRFLFGTLPGEANFISPKFDATVFVFALVVSLLTGFLFGAIPAFKASRVMLAEALKEDARTAGRSSRRVTAANILLVGQVAFSFLLLVTAALFLRGIARAYDVDPGYQTAHLAVFPSNPGQAGYGKARAKAFYKDVGERVAQLPGIESVSWDSNMPLWAQPAAGLQIEGYQARSQADKTRTIVSTVDLNYFETAGVGIEHGRAFTNLDRDTSAPVAIVNQKLAHDYWPNGALGKRIQLPGEKQMREIVGVARTAAYSAWGEPPQFCVYVPLEQKASDAMVLYVRTKGDPHEVMLPVEREMRAVAPQVVVFGSRTGSEIKDGGLFQERMGVTLLSIFGLLALGLASVGLYGILAYSVNQRKREIGLRMALGASRSSVLKLILRQGMSLVLAGVALGFLASQLSGRLLSRLLYGVGSSDPISIAGAALTLAAVALLACFLPAHRATRIDPLTALRET